MIIKKTFFLKLYREKKRKITILSLTADSLDAFSNFFHFLTFSIFHFWQNSAEKKLAQKFGASIKKENDEET